MTAPLILATGDPAGVGPAVCLAAAKRVQQRVVLVGDAARLRAGADAIGLPLGGAVSVLDAGAVGDDTVHAHAPTVDGGRAQLRALDMAVDEVLAGRGRAVVTAPTSKEAVQLAGVHFTGQTEHLAFRAGLASDAVTMMFLGPRLRVALATTHLSLRALPDEITEARVRRAARHLVEALARLERDRPLVAVTGLNPHAGERGLFGDEETRVVSPAVAGLQAEVRGLATVEGPLGAETAFRRAAAGEVDGVVAMFHDQATIASKLLDWGSAVNVTWGLPFVRTSVDHGVAYAAARADAASPDGMIAAVELAARLAPA